MGCSWVGDMSHVGRVCIYTRGVMDNMCRMWLLMLPMAEVVSMHAAALEWGVRAFCERYG